MIEAEINRQKDRKKENKHRQLANYPSKSTQQTQSKTKQRQPTTHTSL